MCRHQAKRWPGAGRSSGRWPKKASSSGAPGRATIDEEIPEAYKDAPGVVDVVHGAGISKKVA